MVGREIADIYARGVAGRGGHKHAEPLLTIEHLAASPRVKDVSFSVAAGEILGLAGLVGAGRSECVEALFGLRRVDGGSIRLAGKPFNPRAPVDAVRLGVGFIPEDRRRQGLVQDVSVRENLLLAYIGRRRGFGLGYEEYRAAVDRLLDELGLPHRILDEEILTLSGDMQQKIVLARWILMAPKLLILDEPTRGVDIGTRSTIYAMVRRLAQQGMAVLLVSSDFEEVIGLCDRIVVISDGMDVTNIPSSLVDVEKLAMILALSRGRHCRRGKEARCHDHQLQFAQQFGNAAKERTGRDCSEGRWNSNLPDQFIDRAQRAKANIPVVIADIGTSSGNYVSFIISDNEKGAHDTGVALAAALKEHHWDQGPVGLVTISLARNNGKARTKGFRDAMKENGDIKEVALDQMQRYTADETFKYVQDMLTAHPDLHGIFVQTDTPTLGAVRAIQAAHRQDTVLLAAFDGVPEFIDLILSTCP